MCNTTHHTDCYCNRPEYANHGTLCPTCEAERDLRDRIAEDDQREREWLEREAQEAELNNQHFADACGQMTREDWDADNDWLASAGWGEM
jgi:hypothetical protein